MVTGPPCSIWRVKSGTTEPEEPSTLPKRTIENTVRAPLRIAAAWKINSAARLEAPITLVGRTALSVYFQTFFISGALAGITGVLLGISFNSVHSFMGDDLLLRAFVVIVLGGLGSIQGAVVAGLLMGLAQTFLVAYTSSELSDVAIFTALIAFLLYKPQGMFAGLHVETRVGRA